MVLTSNSGALIKAGYLALPAINWEKSENWEESTWYRVTNFTGLRSKNKLIKCLICTLFSRYVT